MIAQVIVDVLNSEVDRIFDYEISTPVEVGTRVLVPFGGRTVEGYILSFSDSTDVETSKLKKVISCDEKPIILPEMIEMINFMVTNFNLRKMDAIRLFLPSGLRKNKIKEKIVLLAELNCQNVDTSLIKKNAKNQIECLNYLKEKNQEFVSVLNEKFSSSAVKKLVELNFVKLVQIRQNRTKNNVDVAEKKDIVLTERQQQVIKTISQQKYQSYLLFGVTGSGKTEVYMNAIKNALSHGQSAIMLVPEISLTPQILRQFKQRFGDDVALLHSGLSQSERFDEWFKLYEGKAKIVVGARSAIFAPLKNLGIIIIDEEHDSSYYSESNPRFSTIDVAKFRAKYNNCALVLGSATPDVESFYKAQKGEYQLLEMPERVNKAPMPTFKIVDMLSEIRNGNNSIFSRTLIAELSECLSSGKQAMLYLNRRGYQSSVVCKDCGNVVKCEHCDVPLVYHKEDGVLKCHYCDARYHLLSACPNCGSTNLRYGAIGTQKVVEELKKLFPRTKVFRMDNDNTRTKNAHYEILKEFASTKSSILVGTQMIAKGHDFPLVTLVGIIDADMGLHFADFRASERTFSLITQVAGRAGRGEYEGRVVLQTYMPNHYTYRCAVNYDYKNFFKHELNIREVTKFPPFVTILRVLISGDDEQKVVETTRQYMDKILGIKKQYPNDLIYLNAMKCPIKKIQNKIRYQILMRIGQNNYTNIRDLIYNIDRSLKKKDITSFVEVNPQNLS